MLALAACTHQPAEDVQPDLATAAIGYAYSVPAAAIENNDLADYAFIVIRDTIEYVPVDTVDIPQEWSGYQVQPATRHTDVVDLDYAPARSGRLYAFEVQ